MQQIIHSEETENQGRKQRTQQFYGEIRKEFTRMKEIRKDGISIYNYDHIINEVSKKFFRAPKTIENIIWGRV